MKGKNLCFQNEFCSENAGFSFLYIGESKHVFTQSQIPCIGAMGLLAYRLTMTTYLIFGMVLSITTREKPDYWPIHISSIAYMIVIIYFITGLSLSCYCVFCKKYFYDNRDRFTLNRDFDLRQITEVAKTKSNIEKNGSVTDSTRELMSTSTSPSFSVDSIIFDIEEISKKISIASTNVSTLRHARLEDNRLPSVNSDIMKETKTEVPIIFKINWFFSSLALDLSFIAVLVYWIIILPTKEKDVSELKWYLRIDRHGIGFILVLLDHVLSKLPIRILHFIYPLTVLILYGAFIAVYTYLTGHEVYPALIDFNDDLVKSIASLIICTLIIPVFQFLSYWLIFRLRHKIFRL